MKKSIVAFHTVFLLICTTSTFAKIKLPSIIASNMVLQRNTSVKIWGWANPGEKIIIRTSWFLETLKVTTPENGRWEITMKTTLSKKSQTIQLKSIESNINLENILLGGSLDLFGSIQYENAIKRIYRTTYIWWKFVCCKLEKPKFTIVFNF